MWSLSSSTKIYMCMTPIDMRSSFDRLAGMVQDVLEQDAFSGHMFDFETAREARSRFSIGMEMATRFGTSDWKRGDFRCQRLRQVLKLIPPSS